MSTLLLFYRFLKIIEYFRRSLADAITSWMSCFNTGMNLDLDLKENLLFNKS